MSRYTPAYALLTLSVVTACAESTAPEAPIVTNHAVSYDSGGPYATLDGFFQQIDGKAPGFGGMYIDSDGAIVVLLQQETDRTATEAEVRAFLRIHRPQYASREITWRDASFSFGQLASWKSVANQLLVSGIGVMSDVDERSNVVRIEVLSERAREEALRWLEATDIPSHAITVRVRAEIRPAATLRDNGYRPLMAGLQTKRGSTICTHGPSVLFDNKDAFFTNAHCTASRFALDSSVFYQHDTSHRIGREISDPAHNQWMLCDSGATCRYSDSAIVEYDDSISWNHGAIAKTLNPSPDSTSYEIDSVSPRMVTIGTYGMVDLLGETAYKTGRTTGTTFGEIVNSCTDVIVGPAKLLKCQSLAYGGVSDGDSGSPVWRPADGGALAPQRFDPEQEVYVLGILWGQTVDINGEDQFFFSSTWGMFFDHALTGCCSSLSMVWY